MMKRVLLVAAVAVLIRTNTASAQSLTLLDGSGKPTARAVQGGTVTVAQTGLTCDPKTDAKVTIGANPAAAVRTPDGKWTVTVPASTPPAPHEVRLVCDGKGAAAWLTVIPTNPTVVCARNLTPTSTQARPARDACRADVVWELREGNQVQLEVYQYDQLKGSSDLKNVHLFLDGVELRNQTLQVAKKDDYSERWVLWTQLKFDDLDADNRKAWVQALQRALKNKEIEISAGPAGGPQWPTMARVAFNVYPTGWAAFTIVVVLALVIGTGVLAVKSNLLRGPACAAGPAPYSLARHQMAAWFIVVIGSYLFLMLITGRASTSSTALILIGISGATGLAAVVIDAQQNGQVARDRDALVAEEAALKDALDNAQTGLRAQLAAAPAGSTAAATLTAAIQAKTQRLAEVSALVQQPVAPRSPSRGWFKDLLSDENGISFHRLQIVTWTVVLVGVFARAVWRELAMPDFDNTTLALMGISSGTYLGFKLPQ
jgi:hypothetical protein